MVNDQHTRESRCVSSEYADSEISWKDTRKYKTCIYNGLYLKFIILSYTYTETLLEDKINTNA